MFVILSYVWRRSAAFEPTLGPSLVMFHQKKKNLYICVCLQDHSMINVTQVACFHYISYIYIFNTKKDVEQDCCKPMTRLNCKNRYIISNESHQYLLT